MGSEWDGTHSSKLAALQRAGPFDAILLVETHLCKGFYPTHDRYGDVRLGLRGCYEKNEVTHIRFFQNKTVRGQASLYSPWHPLGDYMQPTAAYPHLHAACPRRLLESYLDKTRY